MGEEFLESEVIFSDPHDHLLESTHVSNRYAPDPNNHRRIEDDESFNFNYNIINYKKLIKSRDRSVPFKIPTPPAFKDNNFYRSDDSRDSDYCCYYCYRNDEDDDEEEEYFRDEIMVGRSRNSDDQNTKVRQRGGSNSGGGGCSSDDGERLIVVVPPHLIVARRVASSVFAHSGRPLRGRNLCEVRNSILRMTGFLETS